jgi:hypothetical protein
MQINVIKVRWPLSINCQIGEGKQKNLKLAITGWGRLSLEDQKE